MDPVGSPVFRQNCVDDLKRTNYKNRERFFERYLAGENFDSSKLNQMGYDHWSSRNIDAYINHQHDTYYAHALSWE